MAETIQKNIRSTDIAARFGGDEFVVLLPETGEKSAQVVIEKIQKELLHITKINKWPVTLSVGAVTFKSVIGSLDKMIKRADNLMYSVKQNGKNMIRQEVVRE